MRPRNLALALVTLASSAACTEITVKNKTPIAQIDLTAPSGTGAPCNYNMLPISTPCTTTPPSYPNRVVVLPIFAGSPVSITLSAARSTDPDDPDGKPASYRWLRTDLPRAVRYPPPPAPMAGMAAAPMAGMGAAGMAAPMAGMGAGGMAAPMAGAAAPPAAGMAAPPPLVLVSAPSPMGYTVKDPPDKTAMATVSLPAAGSYRFSVWAIDDKGLLSAPASLTIDLRPMPAAMP